MSAKPILYQVPLSPPVRTVLMVAKAIGLELDEKFVDLMSGANLTPEFLAMNPQHTVPTLDDNGKYLWDSHAISTYLIGKYGNSDDHPLYPKDLYTRARIDQRLHFNSGTLFAAWVTIVKPIFREGATELLPQGVESIHAALAFLETFLAVDTYMVGDSLTLADLAIVTSVTQVGTQIPIEAEKYPKVVAWIKRLETTLPYYEINASGVEKFKGFFSDFLARNRAATQ